MSIRQCAMVAVMAIGVGSAAWAAEKAVEKQPAEKPPATRPATRPATAPAAGGAAGNIVVVGQGVQGRVVVNGQEVQGAGNGKVEIFVAGGDGNNNVAPAIIRPQVIRTGASGTAAGAETPARDPLAKVPAKLEPFAELTRQCAAFRAQTSTLQWKTIYEEDFASKDKVTWSIAALDQATGEATPLTAAEKAKRLNVEKIKERTVLTLDAEGCSRGTLAVGPKVRGNYAIEMVAANQTAAPCDLSLFVGPVESWIGLQFGGQLNRVTAIIATRQNMPDGTSRTYPTAVANNVPIEAGRFYTVRVEVKNALVKGFIDGKMIVQGKLNMPDETKVEQQPHIYTWASKIAVDKVKTEMEVEVQNIDADKVWDKVFAGRTKAQVGKQIEDLVEMLADEDAAVRDAATEMLKQIGQPAVEALKGASTSGIIEQASRAKELLRYIQPGS